MPTISHAVSIHCNQEMRYKAANSPPDAIQRHICPHKKTMDYSCCNTNIANHFPGNGFQIDVEPADGRCVERLKKFVLMGLQKLFQDALEEEADAFIARYRDAQDEKGRRRLVRNGYMRTRFVQTGLGDIKIDLPRVRDLQGAITFSSSIITRYSRKLALDASRVQLLLLEGFASGQFFPALQELVVERPFGLSDSVRTRLDLRWRREHSRWLARSFVNRTYEYLCVYRVRNIEDEETQSKCPILLLLACTTHGALDLLSARKDRDGEEREWVQLLEDVQSRGMHTIPRIVLTQNLPAFLAALQRVYSR